MVCAKIKNCDEAPLALEPVTSMSGLGPGCVKTLLCGVIRAIRFTAICGGSDEALC